MPTMPVPLWLVVVYVGGGLGMFVATTRRMPEWDSAWSGVVAVLILSVAWPVVLVGLVFAAALREL